MQSLKHKYEDARRALDMLRYILDEPFSEIIQDATIQRFRYTFEAIWKFFKNYLKHHHDVVANNPKAVFHELHQHHHLTDAELDVFMDMTDRRNESNQSYKEPVAHIIYTNTLSYTEHFQHLLDKFQDQYS
jgi:nucleotidyltransferase substrate binding protein (TIGR01987 family)